MSRRIVVFTGSLLLALVSGLSFGRTKEARFQPFSCSPPHLSALRSSSTLLRVWRITGRLSLPFLKLQRIYLRPAQHRKTRRRSTTEFFHCLNLIIAWSVKAQARVGSDKPAYRT